MPKEQRCPLEKGVTYADTEGKFAIPDICRNVCQDVWDRAVNFGNKDDYHLTHESDDGISSSPCEHDVDSSSETLQRIGAARRGYSAVWACEPTGEEVYAYNAEFVCPNN